MSHYSPLFEFDGLLERGLDDTPAPPMYSSPQRPDVPRSSFELLVFPFPSDPPPLVSNPSPRQLEFPARTALDDALPLGATSVDSVVLPPHLSPPTFDHFDFDPYLRSGEMPIAGGPPWQPRRRAVSDDSFLRDSVAFPSHEPLTLSEPGHEVQPAPPPRLRSASAPAPSAHQRQPVPPSPRFVPGRRPYQTRLDTSSIAEEPSLDDLPTGDSSFSSSTSSAYGPSRATSVFSDVGQDGPLLLVTDEEGNTLFKCSEPGCDKAFTRRRHLERHAASVHSDERRASTTEWAS